VRVYFEEDFLGGILGTTSGFESQNSMFSSLTCPNLNLEEIWVRFVHAEESQRHRERKAENASLTSFPELKTSYESEKHARNMYTHTNFYICQRQLYIDRIYCDVQGITNIEGDWTYQTKHNYENKTRIRYVVYNERTSECQCSCFFFILDGIPYAHILLVFTSNSLREIPTAYIINRLAKLVAKALMHEFDSVVGDACGEVSTQNKLTADAWSQFYKCMDLAGRTPIKLQQLLSSITSVDRQFHDIGGESMSNAVANLQTHFGCAVPAQIEIHPPLMSITKGRGKMMKTGVEK